MALRRLPASFHPCHRLPSSYTHVHPASCTRAANGESTKFLPDPRLNFRGSGGVLRLPWALEWANVSVRQAGHQAIHLRAVAVDGIHYPTSLSVPSLFHSFNNTHPAHILQKGDNAESGLKDIYLDNHRLIEIETALLTDRFNHAS